MKKLFLLLSFIFFLASCGGSRDELETHVQVVRTQTAENLQRLLRSATSVRVEVIYEAGAQPYTAKSFQNRDNWQITEDNIKAIYDARNMSIPINVPKELNQMTLIASENKSTWTANEVIAKISSLGVNRPASNTEALYTILFVNGNYHDGSKVNSQVIGINITGTTVIVIFKDVVEAMGLGNTPKFAEQSTIVHEIGHAVGLVNNGVPLTSSHHDSSHGAHCTNQNCVNYWLNEGSTDMVEFVNTFFTQGHRVMYGSECLNDLTAY